MRTLWLALALCAVAATQPALVRGVLLERDDQQFSVRAADNQVFRFQFDKKTYVEREDQLIEVARLQAGEKVEVVSDGVPGSLIRYARTIHVLSDAPPPPRRSRPRATEYIMSPPTGNLT